MNGDTKMREYQPQTSELLELGIHLLESGKNGIKCFISDQNNRLIAEIDTDDGTKKIGYLMPFPTGNKSYDLPLMEQKLANEIMVYFGIEKTLKKVSLLVA